MITINLIVNDQEIELAEPVTIVSGSENVYLCKFTFTSEWAGFEKTAVFLSRTDAREVYVSNNQCTIPWEALEIDDIRRQELKIGVYGVKDDVRMPTVYTKPLTVHPGAETAEGGGTPTPTQWEQILSMLADGTVYLDPTLTQSNKAAQADIVGDEFKKAVQSSLLYIQASNTGGYSDADDFPANRIIDISSNITAAHIANLPAYGEPSYVLTLSYNPASDYSAQVFFGRDTTAVRMKFLSGWTAWRIEANADDVVTLDTSVDDDHGTYSDKIANVSKVCVFVASLTNWSDLPAELKGNATIINMHQASSYDMQVCIGRGEDKYFGWRIIRRSDRVVNTDWKSPTADLLINGNLLYGNGTSLNIGGGTGTCEVIKITDCPNMNIVSGVKVTRDSGTTGFLGTRTATKFHCVAGTTYEFSVWARGTGTVRLLVDTLYLRDFECDANGKWQKFTLRFTSNADADYHFYVYNITPDSYIDIAGRELFVYTPEPEVAALGHTKYWTPNWFQGSIGPSSGGQISATNRVRSEGMVNFSDSIDGQLTIVIPEGWGLVGRRYGAPYPSAYEKAITVNGTWITGTFTLTTKPDKYYRFVIRKQDDSDITPDDGQESGVSFSYATLEDRPQIKILGIGNSHTNNALGYLRPILDKAGYDAKVANYYWGGSTLKEQYDALTGARAFPENTAEHPHTYYYRTYDSTGSHTYYSGTLVTALADEPWDVIVFQNQTDASGQIEAFFSADFNINDFIAAVKSRVNNDNLKIGIMAPHSRASDTTVQRLHQNQLDAAIQNTIPIVAANMTQCDFIVNTGLAIKYARQNEHLNAIDDELTWDDHHLSAGIPRHIAAMVYAITICGEHIADEPRYSSEDETEMQLAYLGAQCARAAALNRELPPKFDGISARTALSVGDSICYGSRNDHKGFLGDLCIMREDASMYGAYISNYKLGDANNLCIYQQLIDFAGDPDNAEYSPDVIVADGGINDYISNVALGTTPTKPAQNDTDAAALNKATLLGGLEYLFYQMIKLYPEAQRFFVIPHRMNNLPWTANTAGYTQTQMAEAIAATCRIYGVELIDVFNHGVVNTAFQQYISPTPYTEDEAVTDKYYVDHDGIHPLALGYKEGYVPLVREALRKGTHKTPIATASGDLAYLKGGVYGAPLKSVITQIEHEGLTAAHIYVTKKNMLLRPYINSSATNRGVTFTAQEDGTVTASGTLSAAAGQPFMDLQWVWLQPGVVYTFSHGCTHPRGICLIGFYDENDIAIIPDGYDIDRHMPLIATYLSTYSSAVRQKGSFYVNEPCKIRYRVVFSLNGLDGEETLTDCTFHPMVRVGGDDADWDTEPTWEQAEGQMTAVSFEDNAVGRGTLNVTTGELTVTQPTAATYQLPPTEVATLNGYNQIIADTGAVSVVRSA